MLDKVFIDGLSFAAPLLVMAIGAIYSGEERRHQSGH